MTSTASGERLSCPVPGCHPRICIHQFGLLVDGKEERGRWKYLRTQILDGIVSGRAYYHIRKKKNFLSWETTLKKKKGVIRQAQEDPPTVWNTCLLGDVCTQVADRESGMWGDKGVGRAGRRSSGLWGRNTHDVTLAGPPSAESQFPPLPLLLSWNFCDNQRHFCAWSCVRHSARISLILRIPISWYSPSF